VRFSGLVSSLAALLAAFPLPAQQQTGTVTGTVTAEAGAPLANAGVVLVGTARTAVTNARGEYRLTAPAGTHLLRARVIGYAGAEQRVTVGAGETVTANFRLAPSALALSEVTVIGSRTARTAVETPVPVDVISTEEIQETGQTEVNQILTALAPSFNASHQTIADGSDHINPASLRGLGPDQVLVLVNGKRRHAPALVHVNGTFGRGTVGVDLNAIPASAIDRIEVLRDGASAQYGSDAIAGVINIVLKQRPEGIEVTSTSGAFGDGDGEQIKTDLNYGTGLGSRGFLNVTAEFLDRGATDRTDPWSGAIYTGPVPAGGVYTDSMRAIDDATLQARGLTRRDVTMRVGQAAATVGMAFFNSSVGLSDNADFYAFGGVSQRNGDAGAFYRLPNAAGQNAFTVFQNGFLPEIHTALLDRAFTAGVRGSQHGWDVDFSLSNGRNDLQYNVENTVNASMGAASPTTFDAGRLSFAQSTGNLDLVRPIHAPGLKSVSLVMGAEFRVENFRIDAGEAASYQLGNGGTRRGIDFDTLPNGAPKAAGSQGFPGFQPANEVNRFRNSVSVYGGLESELSERVLIDVGGRFERYSDFGSTVTGKAAARLQVAPAVALRGAVSTGFRAPSLHQVWFNNVSTQFVAGAGPGELEPRQVLTSNNESRVTEAFGIPGLKEEKSVNLSLGVALRPAENLSVTLDAYQITIDDRIVVTSQFSSTGSEPDATIRARVAQILTPFQSLGVTGAQFFANAVDTKTRGADVVVAYATAFGGGTVNLTASANLTETKVERVNVPQAMADTFAGGNLAIVRSRILNPEDRNRLEDGLPRRKGSLSARWHRGRLGALVRATHYGPITYHHPSDTLNEQFSAKTLVDLDLSYELVGGVRLAVGGNNVFNTYPDEQQLPVNRDNGRFVYSRRVTQFGMNGGFYYARVALAL
jgi:iron complex outermembrane recepter protein